MHLIAGFESQIAAHGGALAVVEAARQRGLDVGGVALARRDTARAVHVDPLRGFVLPEHVMRALDDVVDATAGSPRLQPGETALVVALPGASADDATSLLDDAFLASLGTLWSHVRQFGELSHRDGG